jgi:hypothetical protein
MAKRLFREGLRRRFPDLHGPEFEALFLKQLARCGVRDADGIDLGARMDAPRGRGG